MALSECTCNKEVKYGMYLDSKFLFIIYIFQNSTVLNKTVAYIIEYPPLRDYNDPDLRKVYLTSSFKCSNPEI